MLAGLRGYLTSINRLARGESYWQAILTSGREVCEVETRKDPVTGLHRPVRWLEDIVASGDSAHLKELWIHTPSGDAALRITEPYTAYQFNLSGTQLTQGRVLIAQIIGRVDDKETGQGIAYIWDCTTQQLYKDEQASVRHFGAWRPGIAPFGALSLEVIGVRL